MKDTSLTISNFQAGVADSPLLGFAKMNNVEIFERQGSAKMQFGAALSFSTASLPTAMVYDSNGNQYVGCLGGHLYKNGTLINTSGGICDLSIVGGDNQYYYNATGVVTPPAVGDTYSSSGAAIVGTQYRVVAVSGSAGSYSLTISGISTPGSTLTRVSGSGDTTITATSSSTALTNVEYLLITRLDDSFNFYGPLYAVSPSFVGTTSGLASNQWKKIVVGIDVSTNNTPYIYVGNGSNIGAISNFSSAAIGSAPFFTWTASALALQAGYYAYSIAQLGRYLVISTHGSASGYLGAANVKKAAMFYWDRTSTSYNIPTFFRENGISQLLQVQNKVYMGVGNRGRVHVTDGTNYSQVRRLPTCFNRQFGTLTTLYPNAMTLHNGELVVGTSTGGDVNGNFGVYTIALEGSQIEQDGKTINIQFPTNMRNSISTGYTGNVSGRPLNIGLLHSTGMDQLWIGWQDGTSYGVDVISYPVATGYTAVIETPYYTVGTEISKASFKRMELALTAPLTSGQSVRISYRENLNTTTWTTLATWTSADFGNNNSHSGPANLASKIKLQFRIEMTQPTTQTFGDNIEIMSLVFTKTLN